MPKLTQPRLPWRCQGGWRWGDPDIQVSTGAAGQGSDLGPQLQMWGPPQLSGRLPSPLSGRQSSGWGDGGLAAAGAPKGSQVSRQLLLSRAWFCLAWVPPAAGRALRLQCRAHVSGFAHCVTKYRKPSDLQKCI